MPSREQVVFLTMALVICICRQAESNSLSDSLLSLQSGYGQLKQELDETKQKLSETEQKLAGTTQRLEKTIGLLKETDDGLSDLKQKQAVTQDDLLETKEALTKLATTLQFSLNSSQNVDGKLYHGDHMIDRREVLSADERGDLETLLNKLPLEALSKLKGKDGAAGVQGPPGKDAVSGGAVYVRWGRTTCLKDSMLLYAGFTAGPRYDLQGAGVNYQCMPPTPEYNSYSAGGKSSYIAGTEYRSGSYGLFPNEARDKNVPCARCYTNTRSAVMMLPAKRTCPSGWIREYEGYLMTGPDVHEATFECVDAKPEYITGSEAPNPGALFYFVKPTCSGAGTTHNCPPYIIDRQLTCVVCSK